MSGSSGAPRGSRASSTRRLREYHLPQPGDNPAMGDLVLAAREGYAFSLEATGDDLVVSDPNPGAGADGFLSTEPKMNAIFVASGAGIRQG